MTCEAVVLSQQDFARSDGLFRNKMAQLTGNLFQAWQHNIDMNL